MASLPVIVLKFLCLIPLLTPPSTPQAFLSYYRKRGVETKVNDGGYITKRVRGGSNWSCVHGGTTVSVVVILDGKTLVSANVGDSTSLMLGLGSSLKAGQTMASFVPESCAAAGNEGAKSYSVISAEHSPESPLEYDRMRNFRPCPERGEKYSEMLFVYDAPSYSKYDCPDIFTVAKNGQLSVTNNGRYYKSVRNEWATLVTTPPFSRFQDALAFTRSVGDLHLQTYGVTHIPDVSVTNLETLFDIRDTSGGGSDIASIPAVLLMCSDGVWDNWKFEHVMAHFMEQEKILKGREISPLTACKLGVQEIDLDRVVQGNDETTMELATRFMEVNKKEAHKNFGRSADNMTAIVCTISPLAV